MVMHAPCQSAHRISGRRPRKDNNVVSTEYGNSGTQYLSPFPCQGSFIIDKTHIQYLYMPTLITILFLRIVVVNITTNKP